MCECKVRHQTDLIKCTLKLESDSGKIKVELNEPLSGLISPGQYAVFYDNDECLGGSMISQLGRNRISELADFSTQNFNNTNPTDYPTAAL